MGNTVTTGAPGLETLVIDLASTPTTQRSCGINSETDQRVFRVQHSERAQYAEKHLLDDYGDQTADWLLRATGIENVRLTGLANPASFTRRMALNPAQEVLSYHLIYLTD